MDLGPPEPFHTTYDRYSTTPPIRHRPTTAATEEVSTTEAFVYDYCVDLRVIAVWGFSGEIRVWCMLLDFHV